MKTDNNKFVFLSAKFYSPLPPTNPIPVKKNFMKYVSGIRSYITQYPQRHIILENFCHTSKHEYCMAPDILKYN